jgi:recombinational DNA repair protein RecT
MAEIPMIQLLDQALRSQRPAFTRDAPDWAWDREIEYLRRMVRDSDGLRRCTVESLVACADEAAVRGLTLNPVTGHVSIQERWRGDSKPSEAQWMLGKQGYRHLMLTHGLFSRIVEGIVLPGEAFRVDYTTQAVEHSWDGTTDLGDEDQLRCAYAVGYREDGTSRVIVVPRARVLKIREMATARIRAGGGKTREDKLAQSPWYTSFGAMAAKTALRALGRSQDLDHHLAASLDDGEDEIVRQESQIQEATQPPQEAEPPRAEPAKRPRKAAPAPPAQPAPSEPPPVDDGWDQAAAEYLGSSSSR